MSSALRKEKEKLTYQDYLTWPDEERWEIIDGIAYNMSPAPKWDHQWISHNFLEFFRTSLRGKKCKPMAAPFDVVLSDENVVQPDVFVLCDQSKNVNTCVQGAPELIIEVLSPSTGHKDQTKKKDVYERYGVKEYLIVDPVYQCVYQNILGENGKFLPHTYFHAQQELPLFSLPGLSIPLWTVFEVEKKEDGKI